MDIIRCKTSSPAGDLLSMLPGMRQMYRETKRKAVIYQMLDMVGVGMMGMDSEHPFKNASGYPVCMNRYMFDMLRPLLLAQEYIADFIIYTGQEIDMDLDRIRLEVFTNQPHGSINRWVFYCFPQMSCDLSESWIDAETLKTEVPLKPVCINFTDRYRNSVINYFFLKKYENYLLFVGLEDEYNSFCKQWNLKIPHIKVKDFLQLAGFMKGCKFFAGNASMCFQIAEGLKIPRILETFQLMPNVIPIGKNAYDFYSQASCEYYFDKLMNEKNY